MFSIHHIAVVVVRQGNSLEIGRITRRHGPDAEKLAQAAKRLSGSFFLVTPRVVTLRWNRAGGTKDLSDVRPGLSVRRMEVVGENETWVSGSP